MNEVVATTKTTTPITLIIGAMGGQGGGVLADWIVTAAHHANLYAQGTSVPGVAQRTGATTYYIEVFPIERKQLNSAEPVLALYPCPGEIDIAIATELLEAGRAIEQGYVSADRTVLITSTHRDYSIGEKVQSKSAFYDGSAITAAMDECAKDVFADDFLGLSRVTASVPNAILLGILCQSNLLPIGETAYRRAITESGIAVDSNLAGFDAGINFVRNGASVCCVPSDREQIKVSIRPHADFDRLGLPADVIEPIALATEKLEEFQNRAYAGEYVDTIKSIFAADRKAGGEARKFALTGTMAKRLARMMCYDDIIQVARAKSALGRHQRVRAEVGCKPTSLLQVTEFLKPGRSEITSILPPRVARVLHRHFPPSALKNRRGRGIRIKSNTVFGFGILRLLAGLRFWRPRTARFFQEAELRARWCAAVIELAAKDYDAALEIAECSDLLRGYGKTEKEGRSKFISILRETGEHASISTDAEAIRSLQNTVKSSPEIPTCGTKYSGRG